MFCDECVCYGGGGEGVGCDSVTNETIDDANRALDVMSSKFRSFCDGCVYYWDYILRVLQKKLFVNKTSYSLN